MGIYEIQIMCLYCQNRCQRLNLNNSYSNNSIEYNYECFSVIPFDLNLINIYMNNKMSYYNNMIFNNDIQYIKLNNCFEYFFLSQNKKFQSKCNYCQIPSIHFQSKYIHSVANILTIILFNNDNFNFILEDEIDLVRYSHNSVGDGKYCIVSILCQLIYNGKFICYCVNQDNGSWYSYVDGGINKVKSMDINAKPIILIYQAKTTFGFTYQNILRDDLNKALLNIRFSNGISPIQICFNKDNSIKNVIEQISSLTNFEADKIKIAINGEYPKRDKKLSEILPKNKRRTDVTAFI